MRPVRAVAFDFNGTLSDDEPILLSVYRELFAEQGRPLTDAAYYATLAGLSEEAIIGTWLGVEGETLEALVEERIDRYLARCGRGETVSAPIRDAVSYAAQRVPVAVVSGAFRREIEPVLAGAGLDRHVSVLVAADDVDRGKPDPAAYRLAVDRIGADVAARDVVAFEDTESGVASAMAAGLRCVAVVRTHPPDRLALADELVDAIDVALLERILG
ncbi:MAG TPA: HAD family phosphatase [Gaiellaceae bacterium]|jgi:beta-phosphoglucomutase|nr:HAD family phosphatase [Gaiellaceae bacterium]